MLNLLRIEEKAVPPDPGRSPQLSLFEETLGTVEEAIPHFLPDLEEPQHAKLVRRTFTASLIFHVLLILFLALHPDLINLGSNKKVVLVQPEEKQVTMLYEPPPDRPKLVAPRVPPETPKTLPRADGAHDSELQKLAPPPPAPPVKPAPQPTPPPGEGQSNTPVVPRQMEPIGIPKFPEVTKQPPRQEPSLETLPKPKQEPPAEAQLRLPEISQPSRGTDAILRDMAKQHAQGGGGLGGGISITPDPNNPNFNMPGPQILSDTKGVNFDPYLLRIYLIVKRNWESVIPEIARLGRKGRVILQFNISKNGTVVNLNMMSGSGTSSMDAAALSSIQLSSPFPPLPPEYPDNDILLRFGYYYNMEPEY